MDNETEKISLEHFRLKSWRRRVRWKHFEREKSLLRLYREVDALRKQERNLGFEPLDPPVQRGYKRFFVLRPEVARSKDAGLFRSILDRINTTQYSSKRDFKVKRRRRGRKVYEARPQELLTLCTRSFKEKKFNEREASYFNLVMTDERPGSYYQWMYVFREPWRFKLMTEPNIIRWTRIKDFDLQRRISEIDRYIESNDLWPHIYKACHGSYQWWGRYAWSGELEKYKHHPLKNRTFANVLHEYWPEERVRMKIVKPSDDEVFFCCALLERSSFCFPSANFDQFDSTSREPIALIRKQFKLVQSRIGYRDEKDKCTDRIQHSQ